MENQDKIAYWELLFKEHDESGLSLNSLKILVNTESLSCFSFGFNMKRIR